MPIKHVTLREEQETRLKTWLRNNVEDILERRTQRTYDWVRWREQYEGKTHTKNFPWPNASNVWVPVTAITTDAIHANMMQRIFGTEKVWDVKAVRPTQQVGVNVADQQPITWTTLAEAVGKFLAAESAPTGMLDIYSPCEDAILECIKLGTAILFNPWTTLVQKDFVLDHDTGDIRSREPVTIFDGLRPQRIPLEDFLITPHYASVTGPDGAPLFGHRYYLRKGQLLARKKEGKYRNRPKDWEKVLASPGAGSDEETLKDQQAQTEGEITSFSDQRVDDYLLMDLWIKFPLYEGDGEQHLFITYHPNSDSILRIQPWIYKTPPYVVFRYLLREGRFYGISIPEMMESIQAGTNTSFNQTIDNATIANMRGFKVRAGSRAAKSFGTYYPGKKFIVDNMDDIMDFQLGEVYPSGFQVGLQLQAFGEKRTGIVDYNLGRESEHMGKYSTATTTMALLQENARRFDLYAKDIKRALGELGMQACELVQQMKPEGRIFTTMGDQAELVVKALGHAQEVNLREHIRVISASAIGAANKEIQNQAAASSFAMLTQYLEKVFELASVMASPTVPEPLRKLAYDMSQTGERLMQRILEGFDQGDIGTFLPQLEEVYSNGPAASQKVIEQQRAMAGPGGPSGGGQGPPPNGNAGGGGQPPVA